MKAKTVGYMVAIYLAIGFIYALLSATVWPSGPQGLGRFFANIAGWPLKLIGVNLW